jgi:hypothetical protein
MAAVDDVDQLIEQYQLALDEFAKGNPEPVQKLFSHREDATSLTPTGSLLLTDIEVEPPPREHDLKQRS